MYVSKLMLAQSDFENGNGMLSQHYLDTSQPNLRGWEYRYLATRIINKRTLAGHGDAVTSVAFRLDGKAITTGSADGRKLWDAETGRVLVALVGNAEEQSKASYSVPMENRSSPGAKIRQQRSGTRRPARGS